MSIGLDVSDRYTSVCVLAASGVVVEESRLRTTAPALQRYFRRLEPARVTLEAGTHSPWMSRLISELNHHVLVANPRRLKLISENDSKDDRTDAELLARMRRADASLLSPVKHRTEQAQADLAVIRARDALVRARSLLVNHARGAVKSFGDRLPPCSTACFARKAKDAVPESLRVTLAPLFEQIAGLTEQIREHERRIEWLCEHRYTETSLLRQIDGVGAITALCFVLTIGDPLRFKSSRSVGSYLGLRPRKDDSGDSRPELRITKAGNALLRKLLVQAAHYILGRSKQDSDLQRWGGKIAARGRKRAKKVAVVAVARKLSVLLHRLWVTGEEYEPLRNANKA